MTAESGTKLRDAGSTVTIIPPVRRFFLFQAEDGIRDCLLSRGLGDVYKRQDYTGI